MNKQIINVPGNIRFISQWNNFLDNIETVPCIIDKKLTGCGFTEWCISNNLNVILCSPRRVLLESKEEYHPGEVLYARNDLEVGISYDKSLVGKLSTSSEKFPEGGLIGGDTEEIRLRISGYKSQVKSWAIDHITASSPCKILVTYDSFRLVKEALQEEQLFDEFIVVVDEFQAIFTDARFKSSAELELMYYLKGVEKVLYVSATPMIEKYLDELEEFKDLPYYELDWKTENPYRTITPNIIPRKVFSNTSITKIACEIIEKYRSGIFEKKIVQIGGKYVEVESKEAVFYINSVKNICEIIKKAGLKVEEVNILCARTPDNEKKVRAALKPGRGVSIEIGKVPKKGEKHKMFTLCTRTVYLGADFCSTNARSFIFSDANIDSLAVDITLDLPQILGRQRLDCNPWKNVAELYYKVFDKGRTEEEAKEMVEKKKIRTENLLNSYSDTRDSAKHDLAEKYQRDAKNSNYLFDYVAVNTHGGKDLVPVLNRLVVLSDIRAIEIQNIDYKDRFSIFSSVESVGEIKNNSETVNNILDDFDRQATFVDKMKYLVNSKEVREDSDVRSLVLNQIPSEFSYYWNLLGPEKIKACGYQKSKCSLATTTLVSSSVKDEILKEFDEGSRISFTSIKQKLTEIYKNLEYNKTPKASDLEEYFNVKPCQITNKETGKRDNGFEIIKRKD